MHILYGVQGTGNGHISRASAMHEAFRAYPDVKITWLLSGRERERGCGVIEDFEWREGITFVKVIVYLPFENLQAICAVLRDFPGFEFHIYLPDATARDELNLHLRPISRAFKQDLLDAAMVMTNSGFELISECLHLGKRILTKPLQGQMEQLSNAAALRELGYARVIRRLDQPSVGAWLAEGSKPVQVRYPDVASALDRQGPA